MSKTKLRDGLEELREVFPLPEVMRLIEHTARWVDPDTFRLLPIWYPEHARGMFFYKDNWSEPQMNKNRQTGESVHKKEANRYANIALTDALGLSDHPNWTCCHIWGVDDPNYQKSNTIVQNPRFYSCVANMVLLPTPLKAFTDSTGEVKMMLRICARNIYGWPDHECMPAEIAQEIAKIDAWNDWSAYPKSWPQTPGASLPLYVIKLNDEIRRSAATRLKAIRKALQGAGEKYPRNQVKEVLKYWAKFAPGLMESLSVEQ